MRISLQEELKFYLSDLSSYLEKLQGQDLKFLESFEKKMRDGLELLLSNTDYHQLLEMIRYPSSSLLKANKKRYLDSIIRDKENLNDKQINHLIEKLKKQPLMHATNRKDSVLKDGLFTAAQLWNNGVKTCANAMDIALRLHFHYVFFTHGFVLDNFNTTDFVTLSSAEIKNAITSSVDIYKIVLVKNNLVNPGIVPTEKWLIALDDYSKQLFSGEDFFELKATYIYAYFDGDIDEYIKFAKQHFYNNDLERAPFGEYPFLGEIKIPGMVEPVRLLY